MTKNVLWVAIAEIEGMDEDVSVEFFSPAEDDEAAAKAAEKAINEKFPGRTGLITEIFPDDVC